VAVRVWAAQPAVTSVSAPANVVGTGTFSVTGKGVAGDLVQIYNGSTFVGTATVAGNGTWTASVDATALPLGATTLTVQERESGSPFASAAVSVPVTVYEQPAAPTINTVPTPPATRTRVTVAITGHGMVGQTVTLYVDGAAQTVTPTVDANGNWTVAVSLSSGTHSLVATESPAAGIVSAPSATMYVTVHYG
jgi:hypothetical protein